MTAYEYFKDNRVKTITTSDGNSELIRHAYTYNSAGDTDTASHTLQGAAQTTQTRSYEYDGIGRLIKEIDTTGNTVLDQLSYDQFGNRRERTVNWR